MNVMCIIVWYTSPPQMIKVGLHQSLVNVLALIITNVSMTPLWSDLRDPVTLVVSICIAYSAVADDSLVFVLHVT